MTSVKSREYLVYKGFSEKIPLRSEGLFCKELVLRGEIGWSGLKSGDFVRGVSEQTSAHYKRGFFAFQVVNMPPYH